MPPSGALPQVAATEVLEDRVPNDRPEVPEAVLVALGGDLLEPLVVPLDEAVEGFLPGEARTLGAPGALGHADDRVQDANRPTKPLEDRKISCHRDLSRKPGAHVGHPAHAQSQAPWAYRGLGKVTLMLPGRDPTEH
jgi:hypothetical protein